MEFKANGAAPVLVQRLVLEKMEPGERWNGAGLAGSRGMEVGLAVENRWK